MGRKSRRGGSRPGAGAPRQNTNGQKRVPLPEWLNLESPDGIRRFMREILVPSAISGKLGVRIITALTTLCKTLLDSEEGKILEDLEKRIEELEKTRKVT